MSVELPAKLKLMSVSGNLFLNASAITGNTSVSEAAAETVSCPLGLVAATDAPGKSAPNPTTKAIATSARGILFMNFAPVRSLHSLT